MTISSQYAYVWFRIAKTGTRSLSSVLDARTFPEFNDYKRRFNTAQYRQYFKFTIIRNPWARLVSCYKNKVETGEILEECWGKDFAFLVKHITSMNLDRCDAHVRRQSSLAPFGSVDYIGKFENFHHACKTIMETIGLEAEVSHLNKSPAYDYRDFYTPRLVKSVRDLYRDDIQLGNYTFTNGK